jgi:hypothetical protein
MAEYYVISTTIKEGLYLAKIAADLKLMKTINQDENFENNVPLPLYYDSDNTITIVI